MNGLYLQHEKLWKVTTKDGKKVNVLCIVDRNHERSVVVLDHIRNFKGIQLIGEYNIDENEDGIGTYPGKRKLQLKLKKGQLKTKKL